jgi:hypothetical protein
MVIVNADAPVFVNAGTGVRHRPLVSLPPNDIKLSGERKRVRCKDEVDSFFMT